MGLGCRQPWTPAFPRAWLFGLVAVLGPTLRFYSFRRLVLCRVCAVLAVRVFFFRIGRVIVCGDSVAAPSAELLNGKGRITITDHINPREGSEK